MKMTQFWAVCVVVVSTILSAAHADVPRVVADTRPVFLLTKAVMAGLGEPHQAVDENASPHTTSLRPSVARNLSRADLVVWMGAELTPWLEDAIETLAPNAKTIGLLDVPGTTILALRETEVFSAHDNSAADEDHSPIDAHAWLDPQNAVVWVKMISSALEALDPENAALYRANSTAEISRIMYAEAASAQVLMPLMATRFLVLHDSTQYFQHSFGLTALGAVTNGHAATSSAARISGIRDLVHRGNVDCILSDWHAHPGQVDAIIAGTATKAVTWDIFGNDPVRSTTTYAGLIEQMAHDFGMCAQ